MTNRYWKAMEDARRGLLEMPGAFRTTRLEDASSDDLRWLLDRRRREADRIEYILRCREVVEPLPEEDSPK